MQKLIKINTDHYIIVDDSEIKEGDYFISDKIIHQAEEILDCDNDGNKEIHSKNYCNPLKLCKKITHSTQPLEQYVNIRTQEDRDNGILPSVLMVKQDVVTPFSLSEVKELIGEVDVEKKAEKFIGCEYEDIEDNIDQIGYDSFIIGYNQALEDNKEKKYTEEDLRKAYIDGHSLCRCVTDNYDEALESVEKYIQSLQPETEWDVEFVDGKLKLK